MTLNRSNNRPPVPAIVLATASDADLNLARNLQHVANLLGIGSGGQPTTTGGCSRATAEQLLNGIDPSKFHPNRDFGLALLLCSELGVPEVQRQWPGSRRV